MLKVSTLIQMWETEAFSCMLVQDTLLGFVVVQNFAWYSEMSNADEPTYSIWKSLTYSPVNLLAFHPSLGYQKPLCPKCQLHPDEQVLS